MSFFEKLTKAIARNQSLLVVGLDPNPEMLPQRYGANENDRLACLQDWLYSVITQTGDRVCAYKPTLGFYQALGTPGLELLSAVLQLIPAAVPVILDAKHGDLNTSTAFAQTAFEQWQVDAITLSPYSGQDCVAPFLVYSTKGVFILCRTSNPGAVALQEYPSPDAPFYLQVVETAKTWGTPEQLYLEVGTTNVEILTKIRAAAPERTLLLRSIWKEEGHFPQILAAGLNRSGEGLLVPVPQDWLGQEQLAANVASLNATVNRIKNEVKQQDSSCDLWMPNICLLNRHPQQDLILQLYDIGCILFGEYVQASGATFSYYIDLRKIISKPQIFHQVLKAYAKILQELSFDRIAGIPYGSLPTATGLSLNLNHPMIFPRKEVKAHGTRRLIEGHFEPGEKVVVVDDILISGSSAMEGAAKLQSAGLKVEDIVVFLDHEGGVMDRLRANGYRGHSVLSISEVTDTLHAAGRIDDEQLQRLQN
ncbi:MAG: bifunctional orotidine-5'-phosphate decarboxylase/orotate phosphoribosyltransferase [Cyanophyceae cyanobacterium]